jgi:hypothetical protein
LLKQDSLEVKSVLLFLYTTEGLHLVLQLFLGGLLQPVQAGIDGGPSEEGQLARLGVAAEQTEHVSQVFSHDLLLKVFLNSVEHTRVLVKGLDHRVEGMSQAAAVQVEDNQVLLVDGGHARKVRVDWREAVLGSLSHLLVGLLAPVLHI